MEQNVNKKTLLLSLLGVIVLVGSVVGITYAMFSFSATGTQTNVIKTGYVSINFANVTSINLTNALPTADASVSEVTSGTGVINTMQFDVASTISGTMTLNYDIGITGITAPGTLTASNVKIKLQKSTNGGSSWTYVLGSSDSGVTIASLSSTAAPKGLITTYGLDGGQFTATGSVKYKLTAWIDSSWTLPGDSSATGACSDTTYTTAATCIAAGKNWIQTKSTTSTSFSFTVTVKGSQYTA